MGLSLEHRWKKVVDAASGYAGIRNKMIADREGERGRERERKREEQRPD